MWRSRTNLKLSCPKQTKRIVFRIAQFSVKRKELEKLNSLEAKKNRMEQVYVGTMNHVLIISKVEFCR